MLLHSGRKLGIAIGVLAVLGLGLTACGDDDDGASVRESGPGASGSGSGSGSGSASGVASGSGSGSGSASGTEECVFVDNSSEEPTASVDVNLTEFAIEPIPDEVAAGTIEFVAKNEGEEPHELVIVRYDGEALGIPKADDGSAEEGELPEEDFIGEIEGFSAGNTCTAAFDLTPGQYVLLCNIVEEEEAEAHYDMGMAIEFTVI